MKIARHIHAQVSVYLQTLVLHCLLSHQYVQRNNSTHWFSPIQLPVLIHKFQVQSVLLVRSQSSESTFCA